MSCCKGDIRMNFNSLAFLIYLPVVLILWRLLPRRYRYIELLAASYLFYAWFNALLLIPVLAITLISYLAARQMEKSSRLIKKLLLAATLTVCLGTLFVFKYLDFCVGLGYAIASLFGSEATFSGFNIILPMGISFYTFQTLSYVIDVYRGTVKAETHYGYYSLFVVFFPQLVAGPIERPQNLIPQLRSAANPDGKDISLGVRKLLTGYIKKIIVADFVARFVDTAYSSADGNGVVYLIATILFALQIYCDFSGYTDIAIGCARLMGIKLSENFDKPYSSLSIKEFWRRWHISLSSWFSDYLYKPLGGNRKGLILQCVNIFIVFLLSGLWHGASLNFAVWGMINGVLLIINTLYARLKKRSKTLSDISKKKWYAALSWFLTISCVVLAWVFFRSPTLEFAGGVISSIFTNMSFDGAAIMSGLGITVNETTVLLFVLALFAVVGNMPEYTPPTLPLAAAANESVAALTYFVSVLAIATFWLYALQSGTAGGFIYFRF